MQLFLFFVKTGTYSLMYLITSMSANDCQAQISTSAFEPKAFCKIVIRQSQKNTGKQMPFQTYPLAGQSLSPLKQNTTALKAYQSSSNQEGLFNLVSELQPNQVASLEIEYPSGNTGEKVVLNALDGGHFSDGKKMNVLVLNQNKKISFDFTVSSQPGLYRVMIKKGFDDKIIRLWVGNELTVAKQ